MARKKLLIAAVIVGLFAMFLLYLYGQQVAEETREFTDPDFREDVVVAARDIPAGTPLSDDYITTKSVPRQFLPPSPLMARDIDIYRGQPVAQNIEAEAMILTEDFAVTDMARTLSGRIPEGERAMAIPVDAISGVAGLLRPGDRVDLLGTFPVGQEDELIPEAQGGESVGYVTMSLLQNVTLLAVGQEISDIPSGQQRGQRTGGYSNVTLSLTPDEAELMVIAQTRGQLQLLLRHRDDLDTVPITRRTLREVLEELDVINRRRADRDPAPPVRRQRPSCESHEKYDSSLGRCVPDIEEIR